MPLKNRFFLVLLISSVTLLGASAQEIKEQEKPNKIAAIQNLITSKNYVFVAESVQPFNGRLINLTSWYNVIVSHDTVASDLPYFGRVYQAPLSPLDGGIRFTSTDFTYTVAANKKGGWEITIMPGNGNDVRQMFLSISDNGNASLRINSNTRQPISYNGYVRDKNSNS